MVAVAEEEEVAVEQQPPHDAATGLVAHAVASTNLPVRSNRLKIRIRRRSLARRAGRFSLPFDVDGAGFNGQLALYMKCLKLININQQISRLSLLLSS